MPAQSAAATAIQPVKIQEINKKTAPDKNIEKFKELNESIAKRAFEIFESNGRWLGNELSDWLQAESEILHPVHLEISETDAAFTVRAEVPGFTAKELNIQVEGNRLTIAGKHESTDEIKKAKAIYSERCAQEVFRSVDLPSAVDSARVNAQLMNGIVNIELPKIQLEKAAQAEAPLAN